MPIESVSRSAISPNKDFDFSMSFIIFAISDLSKSLNDSIDDETNEKENDEKE